MAAQITPPTQLRRVIKVADCQTCAVHAVSGLNSGSGWKHLNPCISLPRPLALFSKSKTSPHSSSKTAEISFMHQPRGLLIWLRSDFSLTVTTITMTVKMKKRQFWLDLRKWWERYRKWNDFLPSQSETGAMMAAAEATRPPLFLLPLPCHRRRHNQVWSEALKVCGIPN